MKSNISNKIKKHIIVHMDNKLIRLLKKIKAKMFANPFVIRIIQRIKKADNYYNPFNVKEYNNWLKENKNEERIEKFKYNPLISVVIPVYNIQSKFLEECLDSILNQTYSNFEICLADDCSTKKETVETLRKYQKKDKRIKIVYRKENGHISKATNSAIEIARGEYVAFMDNDDVITENALYEFVKALNGDPTIDMIYTDEDKIETDGTLLEPYFKPDFSPDTLLGGNYICHFCLFRKSILDKVGWLNSEYDGAQDFDLILRFTEQTDKIYHIPKVLYHWRKIEGSTSFSMSGKEYAIERGKKAVEDALIRRGKKGKVHIPIKDVRYIVEYELTYEAKISIIIPIKDKIKLLKRCLESIYKNTTYKNYEIIIINNNSKEEATFKLLEKYKQEKNNFKVIDANYEFNYSKINNEAIKAAKGEYILLLNNDTEIITPKWLEIMLGYAMQEHIGAVGVKLFYPNLTIQHAGIILGMGGIAGNAFVRKRGIMNNGVYGNLLVPHNYSGVTAACLMVKKEKYEQVNGLDEQLEVAFNDVDFNIKLLEAGYYNIFLPQVHLIHYESKSRGFEDTPEKQERFLKEIKYIKNKWKDKIEKDRFYNPNYSFYREFGLDKKR